MISKIIMLLLFLIGVFFLALPHTVHVSLGFAYFSHPVHMVFGAVVLLLDGLWFKRARGKQS